MRLSTSAALKNRITICALVAMIMLAGGILQAATYNYTVSPDDLADGTVFLNGRGGVAFGYDPDAPKPFASSQAGPAGFGDSCFYSDVQGSAAGGPRKYTSFRMSPRDMFGVSNVTISDLSDISYYTKLVSGIDWQIKVYTEDEVTPIGWYQTRFEWNRPSPVDNDWHQYSADMLKVNKLTVKESGNKTIPGTGLLSDLDALYGKEKILFIDIIASYASSSPSSYSYLDGVSIKLDNGDLATANLVPEPSTLALLGMAGFAAMAYVFRRNRS